MIVDVALSFALAVAILVGGVITLMLVCGVFDTIFEWLGLYD